LDPDCPDCFVIIPPTPSSTVTPTVTPTNTQTPTNTGTATPTPTPTPSGGEMLINPIITENDEYIEVGIDEYLMF
jgi:expansin (peptidoglycan-binding protein)